MKKTFILTSAIFAAAMLGEFILYEAGGTLTGRDAMNISGIISGSVIAFIAARYGGVSWLVPTVAAASIICAVLLVLSFWAANIFMTFADNSWPLGIGFAILAGSILGLVQGKHITG